MSFRCVDCEKEFEQSRSFDGHKGKCPSFIQRINSVLTDEFLIREYVENQRSLPELETETGFSMTAIHHRLKKLGLNRSVKQSCDIPSRAEKRASTSLERYGSPHNFCKENPSRLQWEKRLFEEEGIVNVFQRESVKKKSAETFIKKYNYESPGALSLARGGRNYTSLHRDVVSECLRAGLVFSIEKRIPREGGSFWSYDIILAPSLLVEVNGDYWHGNPQFYKATDLILRGSSGECTVESKWQKDLLKIAAAEALGFKVLVIWETDWKMDRQKEMNRIYAALKNQVD